MYSIRSFFIQNFLAVFFVSAAIISSDLIKKAVGRALIIKLKTGAGAGYERLKAFQRTMCVFSDYMII